jgi:hypothetical protein
VSALAWKSPNGLLGEATASVAVGDVIRTGENFHPHYRVIALAEDRAWIRDTQHGTDHIVPLDRCNRI